MLDESEYLALLKEKIWSKAVGTKQIIFESAYYEQISDAIFSELNERIHPHTIRNFYEDRHQPKPQTLKVLSTYLIGDKDHPKTFQHWVEHLNGKPTQAKEEESVPEVHNIPEPENKPEPETPKDKRSPFKKHKAFGLIALPLMLGCGLYCYVFLSAPTEKNVNFSDIKTIDDLFKAGFELIDSDTNYLKVGGGPLVLHTLPGDYWVKPNESPRITNFLRHPLPADDCYQIEVSIPGFKPSQRWQGYNFYLMVNKEDRKNWIRFSIGYDSSYSGIVKAEMYYSQNGKVTKTCPALVIKRGVDTTTTKIPSDFWMTFSSNEGDLTFELQQNYSWEIKRLVCEFHPPFPLRYFGLSATQGFTDFNGEPLNADPLPVFLEYVNIKGCNY